MKLSKVKYQGKERLKVRKSKAKESYFKTNDIDIDIDGNYIYIEDTSLALDLLDIELSPATQTNISDSFNEISNLLYSKTFKANVSFETSKDIAKDVKTILKEYYSKDKLKSLIIESKRSSQNRAGFRASLTTKLKELVDKKTKFKDLDTLSHKVGAELIRKSELDKKYETYPDINNFRELVDKYFPDLLS